MAISIKLEVPAKQDLPMTLALLDHAVTFARDMSNRNVNRTRQVTIAVAGYSATITEG